VGIWSFWRRALAIAGLSIAVACSGNTSPTPQPTPVQPPVPPATPSSASLLWPLAGSQGRDWVINNYVDLDPSSGIRDYTGASGSGAKTSATVRSTTKSFQELSSRVSGSCTSFGVPSGAT